MSEQRRPYWIGIASLAHPDGPARYLDYLAVCLCYGLWMRADEEEWNWRAKFRRFTDELGISVVECHGLSFDAEVKAVLDASNPAALAWARACIEQGHAHEVDAENPGSVISRLYWPAGSFNQLGRGASVEA